MQEISQVVVALETNAIEATIPSTPAPIELTLEQLTQVSGAGGTDPAPKGTW